MEAALRWLMNVWQRPSLAFAIWVAGCLLLYLPDPMAQSTGIFEFREQYKGFIGPITLAAFVLWLVLLGKSIVAWARRWWWRRQAVQSLDTLSADERQLLVRCLANNQRTINVSLIDGSWAAAQSLQQKGLLQMAGGLGTAINWPCTVPAYAWKELKKRESEFFPNDE